MNSEGYTYSYRRKWENPVFRNLLEAAIWSWMCDTAAWKETPVRFNGELITLLRGQLMVSVRFISKGFCIGDQVTRTFLENLENASMVNTQPTNKGTIITICNYDKYQSLSQAPNELDNTRPTHGQHTANTNKKKDNKGNKEKKEEEPLTPLPDWLSLELWNAYLEMRAKKGAKATEKAKVLIIAKLDSWRAKGHDPSAILSKSITSNWTDIYEPKGSQNENYNGNADRNYSGDGRGNQQGKLSEKQRGVKAYADIITKRNAEDSGMPGQPESANDPAGSVLPSAKGLW